MEDLDLKLLAVEMVDWFNVPENYSVIHFAIERGMSKEELFRKAGESVDLQAALDYGMSVMEYKVTEGAMTGALDRAVALKMLETYNGWKGEVNLLQRNEYKQFMNEASEKARKILGSATGGTSDDTINHTSGIDETPKNLIDDEYVE